MQLLYIQTWIQIEETHIYKMPSIIPVIIIIIIIIIESLYPKQLAVNSTHRHLC